MSSSASKMTNGSADIAMHPFRLPRQFHEECAPRPFGRFDPDGPPVTLDDAVHQRKAQPLARSRIRVGTLEDLEDLRPGVGGDTQAIIAYVVRPGEVGLAAAILP